MERSKINGNYTIWLPEQEYHDFVNILVDKNDFNHGQLWELLLKVSVRKIDLDVSNVYFEPEGDVFVAYTRNYELGKKMQTILNELISNREHLEAIVKQSGIQTN